jgi:hypothetical protein
MSSPLMTPLTSLTTPTSIITSMPTISPYPGLLHWPLTRPCR